MSRAVYSAADVTRLKNRLYEEHQKALMSQHVVAYGQGFADGQQAAQREMRLALGLKETS